MIKKLNKGIVPTEQVVTESGKVITKYWYDPFCRVIERAEMMR